MRIAFISVFYPYRGGIAQFNAQLYEALQENHTVQAFNFTRQYPDFLFPGKTQYVTPEDKAIPVESARTLDSINPFSWQRTARDIVRWKPDLAVFSYWMSFFAVSFGHIAAVLRRHGIETVSVIHNAIPHEPKFYDKPLTRAFFKKNDGLVSMCDAVTADIRILCPKARIIQQPHPVYDHFGQKMDKRAAQEALGLDPRLRTLLFFGLIRDYKGLDLLIDALPLLGEEYQLVIAGESYGSFEKYETQISASGCAGRIHVFNRYIDDEEVPRFFSAADLCVLPYKSATQSGITAIALHFDVPMVATPVGGLAESIGRPGLGVMADAASAEALADAIRHFFDGSPEAFVNNIREVKRTQTWPAFADAVLRLAPKDGARKS
jgi:glycosyltransferase involved in cell wall biosynthesis